MRKRYSNFGTIALLLLILFSMNSCISTTYDSSIIERELNCVHPSVVADEYTDANLTWISRTQQVPLLIENYSIAVGDHVIINGTFAQALNVTECELTIWNPLSGVNATVSSMGTTIVFDTYYLDRTNQTYNIKVNGTTNTDDFVILLRENVTICNFFLPELSSPLIIETDYTDVFNIIWNCEDQNQGDENYYSIWLSRDGGSTFMLLTQNLTQTSFGWDSRPWLMGEYTIRIRGYSVDYSSSECRFDDPPLSYWPGDYNEVYTAPQDAGSVGVGMPSRFSIYETSVSYEFGSTNNMIRVDVTIYPYPPPTQLTYYVTDNDNSWLEGQFSPSGSSFTINIDGLAIGTHILSVSLSYFGPFDNQSVTVVVTTPVNNSTPTTPTSTPQDWSPLTQSIAIGVSIGSITIIALVVALSIRMKRNQVVEYI
jgi:hypothetical protein